MSGIRHRLDVDQNRSSVLSAFEAMLQQRARSRDLLRWQGNGVSAIVHIVEKFHCVLAIVATPWLAAPAIAAPIASPLMLKNAVAPTTETVQYRRGWRGGGYGGPAVGLGIAGALIGGAIIGATQPYGYYGYGPGYYGPAYVAPGPYVGGESSPIAPNASGPMTPIPARMSVTTGFGIHARN